MHLMAIWDSTKAVPSSSGLCGRGGDSELARRIEKAIDWDSSNAAPMVQ